MFIFVEFFETRPYTIIARLTDSFITIAPWLCKYITLKSGTLCLYSTFVTGQMGGCWFSPMSRPRATCLQPMAARYACILHLLLGRWVGGGSLPTTWHA